MAELHIIGQIDKAYDFPDPKLFVRWSLHYGRSVELSSRITALAQY